MGLECSFMIRLSTSADAGSSLMSSSSYYGDPWYVSSFALFRYAKTVELTRNSNALLRTVHGLEGLFAYALVLMLLTSALYAIGTYQAFLESTQMALVVITRWISAVGVFVGFYYLVALLSWMVTRKHRLFVRFVGGLLGLVVSVVLNLVSTGIILVVRPVQ